MVMVIEGNGFLMTHCKNAASQIALIAVYGLPLVLGFVSTVWGKGNKITLNADRFGPLITNTEAIHHLEPWCLCKTICFWVTMWGAWKRFYDPSNRNDCVFSKSGSAVFCLTWATQQVAWLWS